MDRRVHWAGLQGGFCRQKHRHRNTDPQIGPGGYETRPETQGNRPKTPKPTETQGPCPDLKSFCIKALTVFVPPPPRIKTAPHLREPFGCRRRPATHGRPRLMVDFTHRLGGVCAGVGARGLCKGSVPALSPSKMEGEGGCPSLPGAGGRGGYTTRGPPCPRRWCAAACCNSTDSSTSLERSAMHVLYVVQ